jgi:hypothetical protein
VFIGKAISEGGQKDSRRKEDMETRKGKGIETSTKTKECRKHENVLKHGHESKLKSHTTYLQFKRWAYFVMPPSQYQKNKLFHGHLA